MKETAPDTGRDSARKTEAEKDLQKIRDAAHSQFHRYRSSSQGNRSSGFSSLSALLACLLARLLVDLLVFPVKHVPIQSIHPSIHLSMILGVLVCLWPLPQTPDPNTKQLSQIVKTPPPPQHFCCREFVNGYVSKQSPDSVKAANQASFIHRPRS